jgi:hypothetical protein
MAKRRRKPPQPQARPSARELWEEQQVSVRRLVESPLWERQQASIKRLTESPFFRSLQDANRRLRESPLGREMIERTREDAKRWRECQERMRSPEPPTSVPSAKRRRKGGGAKPKLTTNEIKRLRSHYREIRGKSVKQSIMFDELRTHLGRRVSDSTLRRYVVRPLSK